MRFRNCTSGRYPWGSRPAAWPTRNPPIPSWSPPPLNPQVHPTNTQPPYPTYFPVVTHLAYGRGISQHTQPPYLRPLPCPTSSEPSGAPHQYPTYSLVGTAYSSGMHLHVLIHLVPRQRNTSDRHHPYSRLRMCSHTQRCNGCSVTPDQHTPSRDFACAPTPWVMAQVTPHNYITHTSHITHTSRTHNPYLTPCVRSHTSRHIRGATSPVHTINAPTPCLHDVPTHTALLQGAVVRTESCVGLSVTWPPGWGFTTT